MPRLMPVKADAVASVMMKPLMPVLTVSSPLISPPAAPITSASGTATTIGRPNTSIMPPKAMATRPPSAPTAMFIWPTPSVTICAKPTSSATQKLRSIT